jgi:flagellar motor switch protein FliM
MSIEDLLSQDEIDALLHGVSTDEIETHDHAIVDDGDVTHYDFANQERITHGIFATACSSYCGAASKSPSPACRC